MINYNYYLIDGNIIVRNLKGLYERYIKDKGWIEDRDMIGIMTGHIPFYKELTEKEVIARVANLSKEV